MASVPVADSVAESVEVRLPEWHRGLRSRAAFVWAEAARLTEAVAPLLGVAEAAL
jgi:hypothetical protein